MKDRRITRLMRLVLAVVLLAIVSTTVTGGAAADAAKSQSMKVVSIGDSFIAGNGNTNYYDGQGPGQLDIGGPRVPSEGRNCYQSYSSYPWQYVQMLNDNGISADIWHAGCGGAWTYDLLPQWETVPGDWRRGADIVLISAGGNDAGFADIVQACLMSVPLTHTTCDGALDRAEAEIPAILGRVGAAIRQIRRDNRSAHIAIVGYPWLASPSKQRCISRGEETLSQVQWQHDAGLIDLALVLTEEFGDAAFTPVIVSSRFAGQGPCAWTDPLLHDYLAAEGEAFHPNWSGAHRYAEIIFDHDIHQRAMEG